MTTVEHVPDWLGSDDRHWFNEGTHRRIYRRLGAHLAAHDGATGAHFAVWAPNAAQVFLTGDFNGWSRSAHALRPAESSGIWTGFVPGLARGAAYKYHIVSQHRKVGVDKADPCGFRHEIASRRASLVWDLDFQWGDDAWMQSRAGRQGADRPISIYELHPGSWMRVPEEHNRWLTYRELAPRLAAHVTRLGFTHVELLPVMEHPLDASLGYQTSGYFAPTGRHGSPQDLMFLIDTLHRHGVGVILDWVPSQFPADPHGLAHFDGTHLYEHADARRGFHPVWRTHVFDYGRPEVRAFLASSALFWLEHYHADGLRVGGVNAMLSLDHARGAGEWVPNEHGGRENLEAIAFLRHCNEIVYQEYPDVQTCAGDAVSWPLVSRPVHLGGLGFGFTWDQGFAHETLNYFRREPVHRKYHHHELAFRSMQAVAENFVLPFAHDEVMPGKGSLLARMPGDDWQKFANLRLLLAHAFFTPGKKLLFMGAEFGQWSEWNHEASLDWHLVEQGNRHDGLQKLVGTLNWLYRSQPALHVHDADPAGFQWIDCHDVEQSTLSWLRLGRDPGEVILIGCNFTPVPRHNVRLGVPRGGRWDEIFNSDAVEYGGSGQGNLGGLEAAPFARHGQAHVLAVTLPPLGAVAFKPA